MRFQDFQVYRDIVSKKTEKPKKNHIAAQWKIYIGNSIFVFCFWENM